MNLVMFISSSLSSSIKSHVPFIVCSVSPGSPIIKSPLTLMPFFCIRLTVSLYRCSVTFDLCLSSNPWSPDSIPILTIHPPAALSVCKERVVRVPYPYRAIECHLQRLFPEQPAKLLHPFPVKGKEIVIEKNVPHPEVLLEKGHVLIEIFSRIKPEASPEDRPVAIGALVRTAPAGDYRSAWGPGIIEKRGLKVFREPFELVVCGKRKIIEFTQLGPKSAGLNALGIAGDHSLYHTRDLSPRPVQSWRSRLHRSRDNR